MMRFLGVIACMFLFSTVYNGQTESTPKPKAYVFADFGALPLSKIRQKMRDLAVPVRKDNEARAYIINYGSREAVRRRRKALTTDIGYLEYDLSHVTFVDGPYRQKVRTVMWIVPAGAEKPIP